MTDNVNHPKHYQGTAGVECIEVAEWLGFNLGNAFKYVWRAGEKGDAVEDLNKALWYVRRERVRRARGIANIFLPPRARADLKTVTDQNGPAAPTLQLICNAAERAAELGEVEIALLGLIANAMEAKDAA